jgi:hypothetical protein
MPAPNGRLECARMNAERFANQSFASGARLRGSSERSLQEVKQLACAR